MKNSIYNLEVYSRLKKYPRNFVLTLLKRHTVYCHHWTPIILNILTLDRIKKYKFQQIAM